MNPVPSRGHAALILAVAGLILSCTIMPVSAVTVTDDAGNVIALNATPLRIVSLAPSNTEILAALGLLDRMAGVTDVCDYPPEVKNLPRIGGYSSISTEKVAAARPDLVVASDITPRETVNRIRELGLSVVVVSPHTIADMIRDIRMLGTLTGTEDRAEDLADTLSARLAAIAAEGSGSRRPTIAHVVWNDPLYVSGSDTLQDDVIGRAGGTNAFAGKEGWGTVTLEEFLMKNPDIIVVSGGGGMDNGSRDVILEDFMENPHYASLSAVKNHQVYAVDADVISRAGPRIVDAVEQVAAIVRSWREDEAAADASARPAATARAPGYSCAGAVAGLAACIALGRWSWP